MKRVKEDERLKKEWGDIRRQITPKIGQLTNDDDSVSSIVRFLCHAFYILQTRLPIYLERKIDKYSQTGQHTSSQ